MRVSFAKGLFFNNLWEEIFTTVHLGTYWDKYVIQYLGGVREYRKDGGMRK